MDKLILIIFDVNDTLKPIPNIFEFLNQFLIYYIDHENLLFKNKIDLIQKLISKYL